MLRAARRDRRVVVRQHDEVRAAVLEGEVAGPLIGPLGVREIAARPVKARGVVIAAGHVDRHVCQQLRGGAKVIRLPLVRHPAVVDRIARVNHQLRMMGANRSVTALVKSPKCVSLITPTRNGTPGPGSVVNEPSPAGRSAGLGRERILGSRLQAVERDVVHQASLMPRAGHVCADSSGAGSEADAGLPSA